MSYLARDNTDIGNQNNMDINEPRRYGGDIDDKALGDSRDGGYDSNRGHRPPFGRGGPRRLSPGRDRPPMHRDFGYGRGDPIRDRSPIRGLDRAPDRSANERFSDRYKKDDMGYSNRDYGRKDAGHSFYGNDSDKDRFEGRSGQDTYKSRFDGPSDLNKRPMSYSSNPPSSFKPPFNEVFNKPNECEIIAMNKNQRDYAESVEARIKDIGIVVDMVFLKDEALVTQTIDDMARKGTLYAMVISPQNEHHGSVTVNILHGTPQEHRNMPLEDALKLLARNFHDYIRVHKDKTDRERAERGPYKGSVSTTKEIQFLLQMIIEGRWVSLQEINTIIEYLTQRRDKMQGGTGEDVNPVRAPPPIPESRDVPKFTPKNDEMEKAKKEQDLQDRILKLMNQGAPPASLGNNSNLDLPPGRQTKNVIGSGSLHAPGVGLDDNLSKVLDSNIPLTNTTGNQSPFTTSAGSRPTTNPTSTYINFDSDSVQKALDNLMQSGPNLLKNITSTLPPSISSEQPVTSLSGASPKIPGLSGYGANADRIAPPPRSGLTDVSPTRGGLGDLPDIGQNRGSSGIGMGRGSSGIGGYGQAQSAQRGIGASSDSMGLNQQTSGGYGSLSDGGAGNQRNYNTNPGGMSGSGMGIRGMQDMSRMGNSTGSDLGRGSYTGASGGNFLGGSGNFPGPNQFSRYGNPGQAPFNSGLGNLGRPGFGPNQGMGGPRRY